MVDSRWAAGSTASVFGKWPARLVLSELVLSGLALLMVFPGALLANPPNISEWAREALMATKLVPPTFVIAESLPAKGSPKFYATKSGDAGDFGFARLIDAKDASLAYMLNEVKHTSPSVHIRHVMALQRILGTTGVILANAAGSWQIITVRNNTITMLGTVLPGRPGALRKWLAQALGYNGIVYGTRGSYILTRAEPQLLHSKIQALILDKSADKTVYNVRSDSGTGIIELVAKSGSWAVFQPVLGGGRWIQPGTKILIQGK